MVYHVQCMLCKVVFCKTTNVAESVKNTKKYHVKQCFVRLYYFWSGCVAFDMWCDHLNELEFANTVFKMQPNKAGNFVCFLLLVQSFKCLFLWNQSLISVGFSPNWSLNNTLIENAKKLQIICSTWLILLDRITCYILRDAYKMLHQIIALLHISYNAF